MKKSLQFLFLLVFMDLVFSGCGIHVVKDEYSLDRIEGDIRCEYRIGKDAEWKEECVDSEVEFDKDQFLDLFHEYTRYDPVTGSEDPMQYDLKIKVDEQPEEWRKIRDSEFNVRAVFGDDQRNVSIYRYEDKLYFYVLSMGGRTKPEKEGQYFIELPEEMSEYWQTIIQEVEAERKEKA